MKMFNSAVMMFGGVVASLCLMAAKLSMNTACFIWFHQPAVPDSVSQLKNR